MDEELERVLEKLTDKEIQLIWDDLRESLELALRSFDQQTATDVLQTVDDYVTNHYF